MREITIDNMKLLRQFRLPVVRHDQPRMWTAILGENGLCKTSILRAIAMAASGSTRSNQVADVSSLPDRRRPDAGMQLQASFELPPNPYREHPGLGPQPAVALRLSSSIRLEPGHNILKGTSSWDQGGEITLDPLEEARARNLPLWFVAGYGTTRLLPRSVLAVEKSEDPALGRIKSLFDRGNIIGTGFADLLPEPQAFAKVLRDALIESGLLPLGQGIELRGRGGVRSAADLVDANRFDIRVGGEVIRVPATWLSQGYQSTIAWIADIIGQVFWEARQLVELAEMDGLVLIDELDLHLHPKWQVSLIPILKRVFPRIQFIVTTHSPMILPGLEADEVVVLRQDAQGNVVIEPVDSSPALMTGSEIFNTFFGISRLYPTEMGGDLQRYGFLVGNAARSHEEEAEMNSLRKRLADHGLDPGWIPVPRLRPS